MRNYDRYCVDCKLLLPQNNAGKRCDICSDIKHDLDFELRQGTTAMKAKLIRERGKQCQICLTTHQVEMHHIVPVEAGGKLEEKNLLLLCQPCHRMRTNYTRGLKTFPKFATILLSKTLERCSL